MLNHYQINIKPNQASNYVLLMSTQRKIINRFTTDLDSLEIFHGALLTLH